MALTLNGMTIIQAAEDATGWRPEDLPAMDGRVTTTGANLRAGPSVNLPVAAVLKANTRVLALGVSENGMQPVAVVGWVSSELLQKL